MWMPAARVCATGIYLHVQEELHSGTRRHQKASCPPPTPSTACMHQCTAPPTQHSAGPHRRYCPTSSSLLPKVSAVSNVVIPAGPGQRRVEPLVGPQHGWGMPRQHQPSSPPREGWARAAHVPAGGRAPAHVQVDSHVQAVSSFLLTVNVPTWSVLRGSGIRAGRGASGSITLATRRLRLQGPLTCTHEAVKVRHDARAGGAVGPRLATVLAAELPAALHDLLAGQTYTSRRAYIRIRPRPPPSWRSGQSSIAASPDLVVHLQSPE